MWGLRERGCEMKDSHEKIYLSPYMREWVFILHTGFFSYSCWLFQPQGFL